MSEDNRMRITIGAIDEDGEFNSVYAGMCTRARCMEIMQNIMDEDSLPILEVFGKHDKFGEELPEPQIKKVEKVSEAQNEEQKELSGGLKLPSFPMPVCMTLKVGSVDVTITGEEEKAVKALVKMAPMMMKINKSMMPKLNEGTGLLAGIGIPAK